MYTGERSLVVIGLVFLVGIGWTDAIDDKCGACRAVANALFQRVDAELPKNALDMRHRLDKNGKRYGKVIDYKLSELRMDALLSTLCDEDLKDYQWTEASQEDTEGAWSKGRSKLQGTEEKTQQEQWSKHLVGYCHSILESHEDDIIAAIRTDNGTGDTQRSLLCSELRICPTSDLKDEL